ncbi:MAG: MerR family transcriptional regulator [Candidatus Omnitrophica bacterium]|nr:MerR family transcriptional regulator [Candidatus Omnitrophota bacterium]MCM8828089.1 MerR family transcriptional regulator [Candidatus Omnitrophota bacterium]
MSENPRYYSIKEVAKITGIAPHILRYWETQFSFLRIQRDHSGRRIYSEKDMDRIKHIQKLLYEDGYKIHGVKKKIRGAYDKEKKTQQSSAEFLKKILRLLKEIEKCLP